MATNQHRIRALRKGRVEDAPGPHPFGVALVRADVASLPLELKAAAKHSSQLGLRLRKGLSI